jgi:O-antigen/teichoic acid export membrane protein
VVAVALALLFAIATGRTALLPQLGLLCAMSLLLPIQSASLLPFQFGQSMHRLVVFPFLASVVRLGTTFLAARSLNSPLGYQLSSLVAVAALVAMQLLAARRYYPERLRFDPALALALLAMAWPAAVESFVVTVYARGNFFFLHDAPAVMRGEFAAADRLVKPVLIVASALFVSSLPTVATLASEKNFALLRRMFLRSTLRVGQVLVPVIALAWYFTSWLLEQLAPEYAGAVWPFRILSIGAAFMFLNNLATTYIVALGQFRAIMFVSIVNLFVYLLLASSLIPALGAVGAALSTAAMEGCNSLMQVAIVLVLLGRKPRGAAGDAPRPEEPDPAGAGSAAQGR